MRKKGGKFVKSNSQKISLILPVKNEGKHIQNTINSILCSQTIYPIEMIVVDDASIDGCCQFLEQTPSTIKLIKTNRIGSANARNLGVENANGDYLIFCDAHLFVEDYFIDILIDPILKGLADAANPAIGDASNRRF